MGLSFLVFPSTEHTRFQHALGAMHLATKAVASLRKQGVQINDSEAEALYAALLLHDLGHGPFSHAQDLKKHRSLQLAILIGLTLIVKSNVLMERPPIDA